MKHWWTPTELVCWTPIIMWELNRHSSRARWYHCHFIQTPVTWQVTLIEGLPRLEWAWMWWAVLVTNWCGGAFPTVGSTIPYAGNLGPYKKAGWASVCKWRSKSFSEGCMRRTMDSIFSWGQRWWLNRVEVTDRAGWIICPSCPEEPVFRAYMLMSTLCILLFMVSPVLLVVLSLWNNGSWAFRKDIGCGIADL